MSIVKRQQAFAATISLLAIVAMDPAVARADAAAPAEPKDSVAAGAQDTVDTADIVVTGSRIRGVAPVGSSIVAIGESEIAKIGVSSTSELLRTVPSVLNLGTDPSHYVANQKGNANVTFATGINLRGIGTADTLVLVNGHRVAPAGIGAFFTDTNIIPEAAVSRLEVQADGASAIYGADAVGGVVNVHLREPFDGAESSARFGGGTGQHQYVLSQTFGRTWSTGGFFVAAEYRNQSALKARSLPNLYTDNYTQYGGPDLRSTSSSPGNLRVGNTLYALPANPTGGPVLASQLVPNTSNLQGFYTNDIDAIPAQHRTSVLATFRQELVDNVELFAEGLYSSQGFRQVRTAGADGVASLNVPSTNPFYITGVPGLAAGAPQTVLYSLIDDVGPVVNTGGERAAYGTVGLRIKPGGGKWLIEPSFSWSTDHTSRLINGNVNNCALTGAIGGFTLYKQACTGTPAIADSNPATAFNPFAPGHQNAATLARITATDLDTTDFYRINGGVRADGPLFDLPGGTVRLAVGGEYTHDKMTHYQIRNDGNNTPDNTLYKTFDAAATRENYSLFGELYVPLIGEGNSIPFVHSLVLSVAGRYEHYSDFGSTTNPKIGINWEPVEGVRVHGSYGTSFRAPTLSDKAPTILGTAQIQVLSVANGLYPQIGPVGQSVNAIYQVGGNPNLKPETAKTYSLGVDFSPRAIRGLTFSVNYFNLDLRNQIGVISAPTALSDPSVAAYVVLNPSAAQVNALCTNPYFTTGNCANGVAAIIDGRSQNLGRVKTSGLEFAASYSFETGIGTWDLGGIASYVMEFKQSVLPGGPLIEQVNNVNFPLRFTGRASLGWALGGFSATAFLNYQNSYWNRTITPNEQVSSNATVDLTLNYDTGTGASSALVRNLRFTLHVDNLFDRTPPYARYLGNPSTPYFAFDPQNASALGRVMSLQVTKKF